jgi:hypothetical protein
VGLRYGTVRAAGSAFLIAAAVGTGGMTGLTSALAADPAMVTIGGSLVDGDGAGLGGIHLVIVEELPPDGGPEAYSVTTGDDGSFSLEVHPWGTTEAPASLSIGTPPDESIELIGDACSRTWAVQVVDHRSVALAEAAPDPIALTATMTLIGEVCGTTATPPTPTSPVAGGPTNGGTGSGSGSGAGLTPPPTDTFGASVAEPERTAPALTIGFLVGLLVAVVVMLPRHGARRRG